MLSSLYIFIKNPEFLIWNLSFYDDFLVGLFCMIAACQKTKTQEFIYFFLFYKSLSLVLLEFAL